MARQEINIGAADAKTGDTLYSAFTKVNNNFTELFADNLDSVIVANQNNIASTLGGTIDSTKVYFIDGVIDFTGTGLKITVPSGGINITGNSFDVSKLVSSDPNYTLFESDVGGSGNVLGQDYAIEVTGTNSQVYNLTDATGFNAFEFARINYNNCSSLGEITGYRQGLETGTGRFGGKPQLTLSGNWLGGYFIETSIVRGLTDGSYSLFKAGTNFVMNSRFRSNQNIDLPANVSFFDFSPSNFVNPSTVQITDAIVSRNGVFNATDTNITPNMVEGDLVAAWSGNNGMPNTFEGGSIGIILTAETVINTQGVFEVLNGSWLFQDLQHFDVPGPGQLRHLGNTPREYKFIADFVIDGTANSEISLQVVKYDNATTSEEIILTQTRQINNLVGGRDVAFFTININLNLDQNDYVFLKVANNSGTQNVTAEVDSYFIVEER